MAEIRYGQTYTNTFPPHDEFTVCASCAESISTGRHPGNTHCGCGAIPKRASIEQIITALEDRVREMPMSDFDQLLARLVQKRWGPDA
jgi:hypothetical protein